MKPPVAYYGGKSRLAEWIVNAMPPHRVYVEPFLGSGAVFFAKRRARHEILNDVDGNLVTFFRVLRDQPDELERLCRLTPYAREEYELADFEADGLDDLERARRWWIRINASLAKTGRNGSGFSRSVQRGSNNARTVWNRLERFRWACERLAGVTIENRTALEVIADNAAADAVIYCDPPYLGETRRSSGGAYVHEFATVEQHEQLAAVLDKTPATVLLSGYPSPLYEELYGGWHRMDRRVVIRPDLPHATEVIWSNRPVGEQLSLSLSEGGD